MKRFQLSHSAGSTLIELIIVVAIITILASVAMPTFASYRNKSRVSSTMASGDAIRSALASYAASHPAMAYPAAINDHAELVALVNKYGGQLSLAAASGRFSLQNYTPLDRENDGDVESYTMDLRVSGVPTAMAGWCVVVTPGHITKCDPI